MSLKIKLHWAERFLNFYPNHTKLYIRGIRGKNWEESSKLKRELFKSLVPFFEEMMKEAKAEERKEIINYLRAINECGFDNLADRIDAGEAKKQ